MLRIGQIKGKLDQSPEKIREIVCKKLKIDTIQIESFEIRKRSLDARKREEIHYVYTIDMKLYQEEKLLKKRKDLLQYAVKEVVYTFPSCNGVKPKMRPVVVGSGPAGLFCAYFLAKEGLWPIVIERGEAVEKRKETVEAFWKGDRLNPESNVQFGEGGAGTFSDGKLNTMIKDPTGRNREILKLFVEHGACEKILYENKPHIGTDVLISIVKNMREHIISLGGTFFFETKMEKLCVEENKITGVELSDGRKLATDCVVLAIGHSARDTFQMLKEMQISMEPKPFAVGVRVEHPQKMINDCQYGETAGNSLPAADYKLTARAQDGRGVYSFCMCPGGYVVNASSEEGRLAVNGMSYSGRKGENANSAIVVTVNEADFEEYRKDGGVLAGMEFQRRLEEKAYRLGEGKIPIQLFGDFKRGEKSDKLGSIKPNIKGSYQPANVREIFPEAISKAICEGMEEFDKKIPGFSREDVVLSGVESRTSSPVRILRGENCQSEIKGLYPCGEGAGYAGGITSAAADGIKVAEAICRALAEEG